MWRFGPIWLKHVGHLAETQTGQCSDEGWKKKKLGKTIHACWAALPTVYSSKTHHKRKHFIAHFVAPENINNYKCLKSWSERQDSNLRPLRPERSALPG